MISFNGLIRSARAELPQVTLALWASLFFSLSVLTLVVSLAASQACLVAAAVAYAAHLVRNRPSLTFPPIKQPLALFVLFTVLSVFGAANPAVGWFSVRKLVLFVIVLLTVNLVVSAAHVQALLKGLFLSSALAGLVGVGQFVAQIRAVSAAHPDRIYFYMTAERIHGFMGHWMNFGGQQMLVFTMLLAFLLIGAHVAPGFSPAPGADLKGGATGFAGLKAASTGFWWLALVIVGLSILLNFTRGVWLGCLVAAVYLVARWKPRWLWALPALLFFGYLVAPPLVRQRVKLALHPTCDPALSIRLEMWQVALRMIRKHPWLGVGPNNIEQVYTLYLPPGKPPEVGFHSHFHNNFLQLAAERGLPCLAAWVWLVGALGWHFWRIRRGLSRWRWVADGAIAAWLAFLVEGCFEFNFGTSPVLMLVLFLVSTPFVAERLESTVNSPQLTITTEAQKPESNSRLLADRA